MDAETLTLTTSSLFLFSFRAFSIEAPQVLPPKSFELLSHCFPLPSLPSFLPASKLIPNSRFIVDGFLAAGDFSISYFLSHFHSDHYTGLNSNWHRGIIFCSEITASLLVKILNVSPLFVYPIPLNKIVTIDGINVVPVDANHCPGAVQFLFQVGPERHIHTGDFRFCESMKQDPFLQKFVGADTLFLDITYCNPNFLFPSQEESIEYVIKTIERIKKENQGSTESVLFLIASYIVGKERILLEIAQRCNCLLHVDERKMAILSVLGFGDTCVFTENATSSDVHVIGWNLLGEIWPYFRPNFVKMRELTMEKGYSKAVGFISTGWMHEAMRNGFAVRTKESLEIHLVPYSEHSSYDELREYVRFLRPRRVVPIVGVDVEKLKRKHALALLKYFRDLVDETANKIDFLTPFHHLSAKADERSGNLKFNCISELVEFGEAEKRETLDSTTHQSSEQKCLFGETTSMMEGNLQTAIKELRNFLPSWVNYNQILDLIRSTDGDVVQAVSDFFERETEYYNQSNISLTPTPHSQIRLHEEFMPTSYMKVSEDTLNSIDNNSSQDNNMDIKKLHIGNSSATKRKIAGTSSKAMKKGKSSLLNLYSCGPKQSTITKFFGKTAPIATHNGDHIMINADAPFNMVKLPIVDTDEPHDHALDSFLEVINYSMERNAAAALMDKAKGNIDVAVNMHYQNFDHVLAEKEISHTAPGDDHDINCTMETKNLSKENSESYNVSRGNF